MSGAKHFGHDEGAWFWGCDGCNPVDGQRITSLDVGSFGRKSDNPLFGAGVAEAHRVDWVCPVCRAGMSSWHGTALKSCGHCGQSEVPLRRASDREVFEQAEAAERKRILEDVRSMAGALIEDEARKTLLAAGIPADAVEELIARARKAGQELRATKPCGNPLCFLYEGHPGVCVE